MKKKLFENTIVLSLVQVFNYFSPFLVLPYLTRIMGVEYFGLYAFSMSFVQICSILSNQGVAYFGVEKISTYKSVFLRGRIVSNILFVNAVYFISVALLYLIYLSLTENRTGMFLERIGFIFPMFMLSIQPSWYFQGVQKTRILLLTSSLSSFLYIISIFLFVKGEIDFVLISFFYGLSFLPSIVLMLWRIFGFERMPFKGSVKFTIYVFRRSFGFVASRVFMSVYTAGSVFFLGVFGGGGAQLALFTVSETIYKAIKASFYPVVQALYPYSVRQKNVKIVFLAATLSCLLVLFCCYFILSFDNILLPKVFGKDYVVSDNILTILMLSSVVTVPSLFMGYPLFAAINKLEFVNRSVILGSLFFLISIFIYYFFFGMLDGVIVAYIVLLSECIVILVRGFGYFKFRGG